MQKVCELENTGMAVAIGLYDIIVKDICNKIDGVVVPANYNALNQVVISGEMKVLDETCAKLRPGALAIVKLPVSGAFHSPFKGPIIQELRLAVEGTKFKKPNCLIYQNIKGRPTSNIELIQKNLIDQLTQPVILRQTILYMIEDGAVEFSEIGSGNFLKGLVRQINKNVKTNGIS